MALKLIKPAKTDEQLRLLAASGAKGFVEKARQEQRRRLHEKLEREVRA